MEIVNKSYQQPYKHQFSHYFVVKTMQEITTSQHHAPYQPPTDILCSFIRCGLFVILSSIWSLLFYKHCNNTYYMCDLLSVWRYFTGTNYNLAWIDRQAGFWLILSYIITSQETVADCGNILQTNHQHQFLVR